MVSILNASVNSSDHPTRMTAVSAAGKARNMTLRRNFPLTISVFGSSARKKDGMPIISVDTSDS